MDIPHRYERRVLVTGATGFVGGATLAEGLESGYAHRWLCIVRGHDEAHARSRIHANLTRFMGAARASVALSQVDVIVGDIADIETFNDPRLLSITAILHLAAETSYRARAASRRVNICGTRNVAELARRAQNLKRIVYVGTAMICGKTARSPVQEGDYPSSSAEHFVEYTQAKAQAEIMLKNDFGELPIVVARPSIVVGHTVLGTRPSASIFWMIRAGDRLRLLTDEMCGGIDVVPVDWVARTLLFLADKTHLSYCVYHLSAGVQKRTLWRDLAKAFECIDPSAGKRIYSTFKPTQTDQLRSRFSEVFGLDHPLKVAMLRAMREYYKFCSISATFCNERLLREGAELPPSLTEYLAECLSDADPRSIIEQFADDLCMFDLASKHAAE